MVGQTNANLSGKRTMIGADPGESRDTEGVNLSGKKDRGTALKFAVPFIF